MSNYKKYIVLIISFFLLAGNSFSQRHYPNKPRVKVNTNFPAEAEKINHQLSDQKNMRDHKNFDKVPVSIPPPPVPPSDPFQFYSAFFSFLVGLVFLILLIHVIPIGSGVFTSFLITCILSFAGTISSLIAMALGR